MARIHFFLAGVLALAGPLWAQTSPSYNLEEYRLNQGGNPSGGAVLQSASFQVSLDAVGDSVGAVTLAGGSFQLDPSVTESARPPGEVLNLRFTSETELAWDTERSVGSYNLYRATGPQGFSGPDGCLQGLTSPAGSDTATPDPASVPCYFYLVTAQNRLGQEGTSGSSSAGAPRPAPGPCP